MPYSGKVWRVESLENLVNHDHLPSKVVITINKPLTGLFIRHTFFAKRMKRVNLPNILPTKPFRYTVHTDGILT